MSDHGQGVLERTTDLARIDGESSDSSQHSLQSLQSLLDRSPALAQHPLRRDPGVPLIVELLNLLTGAAATPSDTEALREPLSDGETRVLRYLPSGLTTSEIANELYLSVNTVKTHLRHVYAKLGVHRRVTAVERARALGLLSGSPCRH